MKRSIFIECSHLSCHPVREIRTGIQEIQYQVLLSLMRGARYFSEKYPDWTIRPLLSVPWKTFGIDPIPQATLKRLKSEFSDIETLSKPTVAEMNEADRIHVQSVMSLARFRESAPKAQLSLTFYDLGPVHYPDYVPGNILSFFSEEYLPSVSRHAELVVSISEFTARDYIQSKWCRTDQKVGVLRPAPRLEKSLKKNQELLSRFGLEEGKYFVFLGSFEPRKNLAGMIEGYRKFKEQFGTSEAKMVWVGGTGWNNDAYPIDSWVKTGYLPDDEVRDLLQSSAGLILISVFEGFGLPLAQARSLGVPVVTHYGSALPEAAGFNGIFVDPSEGVSIAEGLKRALDVSHGILNKGDEDARLIQPSNPAWNWDTYTEELVAALLESGGTR